MLRNNNQTAVNRISVRSMKSNRIRNLFTILAIILTTFMFTTVFSIGFSLAENMSVMMLRQQGTKASIFLKNPTKSQIKEIYKEDNINAVGIRIPAGKYDFGKDGIISLDYYDETEFEKNCRPAISDVHGTYPNRIDEIMLSRATLDLMNIKNPKLGSKISIQIGNIEKQFKLTGYFTDYFYLSGKCQAFVSKEYVNNIGKTIENDATLSISSEEGKQQELLESLNDGIKLNEGQKFNASFDIQQENGSNNIVIIVTMGLIALIIIISGYLLIYNVMYISVTKDIRFYGMLKTIGTSPKQIMKIVKMQALRLSVVGIPIGTILGTLISFVTVPYALDMFGSDSNGAMPNDISFNIYIYIGTIIFGLITIIISCKKPAKLAAKVAPVEALKYNGQSNTKINAGNSTNGGKLYKMAFRNVFREKKRVVLVFASLFMGTMAFLTTNTFIGSLKLENYVDYFFINDYSIYTTEGDEEDKENDKVLKEAEKKLAEEISKIEGITNVSINKSADAILKFDEEVYMPFIDKAVSGEDDRQSIIDYYSNNDYMAPVISVSNEIIKNYNEKARQKIDLDRFEKGQICLIGYVDSKEDSDEMIGKTITIIDRETEKSIEIEVGACPTQSEDRGINIGYFWEMGGAPSCIIISENALDKLSDYTEIENIVADSKPGAEAYVTSQIKSLINNNPAVIMSEIKSDEEKNFKTSISAMNILASGISIVLILIGVINFINVMITGVYTRQNELAVMESIGMTKKQVKKMLMLEGLYYGLITLMLIMTAGNVLIYLIANMTLKIAEYAVFYYPGILMLCISIVIMLICIIVPSIVYSMVSKESVTERIRSNE